MKSYMIFKGCKQIESGIANTNETYYKSRCKQLGGQALHLISGDVTNVYHNKNNRMTFSHTHTRSER